MQKNCKEHLQGYYQKIFFLIFIDKHEIFLNEKYIFKYIF